MDKVIDLLKSEREQTKYSIEFLKKEIKHGKKAVEELRSPEFIEKHKDSSNWTESWTIKQYIAANVSSNNRAIAKYTEKLEEANEYLLQIERALTVLNEGFAVEPKIPFKELKSELEALGYSVKRFVELEDCDDHFIIKWG